VVSNGIMVFGGQQTPAQLDLFDFFLGCGRRNFCSDSDDGIKS